MLPRQLQFLHPWLHFIGLSMIAAGLPFSVFLMSFGQFWIIGNWLLEARFNRINRFVINREAWIMAGLLFLYIPGIFYSENVSGALKMIRLNAPFLVLPFILAQRPPLDKVWYFGLIRIFLLAVLTASLACLFIGLPRWLEGSYTDIRQISLFISHIRFSLLMAFSILLISWILVYKPIKMSLAERIIWATAALFLLTFLFILQSLTGLFVLFFVGSCWGFFLIWKRLPKRMAILLTAIPAGMLLLSLILVYVSYQQYFTPAFVYSQPLPEKTSMGNAYTHHKGTIENGYYIESFLCEQELVDSWKQRSRLPLRGDDGKGNMLQSTLIRYLNSRGLPKDSEGVSKLTTKDIAFIEQGIANVKYTGLWGIRMRFYQLLWEMNHYRQGHEDASGHTLMMKLEFWRISLKIIRENPLTGVGIGDVPDAFRKAHQEQHSKLDQKWWMTSHNQYLYIAVGAGIPGLLVFLFLLLDPIRTVKGLRKYPPFIFSLLIALISMLTEDTLTTQAGVSFVAFFYSVFLFLRPSEEPAADNTSTISPLTPATA
jgi:hypothetical protein